MPLTEDDRRIIAKARELAALPDANAVRTYAGKARFEEAAAYTLGSAQAYLGLLADIAERLGGEVSA
jgi:hypothetical protein